MNILQFLGYKIARNGHDVLRLEIKPNVYFHAHAFNNTDGSREWLGNVFFHADDGICYGADSQPIITAQNKEDVVGWIANNPNQIRFAVIRAKHNATIKNKQ